MDFRDGWLAKVRVDMGLASQKGCDILSQVHEFENRIVITLACQGRSRFTRIQGRNFDDPIRCPKKEDIKSCVRQSHRQVYFDRFDCTDSGPHLDLKLDQDQLSAKFSGDSEIEFTESLNQVSFSIQPNDAPGPLSLEAAKSGAGIILCNDQGCLDRRKVWTLGAHPHFKDQIMSHLENQNQ